MTALGNGKGDYYTNLGLLQESGGVMVSKW